MIRRHWHAVVFALTLLSLGALGLWWFTFFQRSVQFEYQVALQNLRSSTTMLALKLGHMDDTPTQGVIDSDDRLEIVSLQQAQSGRLFASLRPMHPQLAVRPRDQVLQHIERRLERRRFMVAGEGGFLLLLLILSVSMLHYMMRLERREGQRLKDFISTVTHEMKTPLAGIKSMLQTSAAGRIPAERMPELTQMALRETARLERLIENILVSGRIRSQTLQVRVEPQALWPALEAFVQLRRRDLTGTNRRLLLQQQDEADAAVDIESKAFQVQFDADALRIILENLVDNALKFSSADKPVSLYVYKNAGQVFVVVKDQGCGFSKAEAKNLFKPFVRGRELDSVMAGGTGLGLSIARRLARAMGGELSGESAGPGQGSRFILGLKEAM